ncbi:MAG: PhoH family protein [Verrucomicrobiales bacterium]|nr:PhoH family protein [Verrucomicrobiales bacterium]
MAERTLQYESPHFLHSLFSDDLNLLKEVESAFPVTVTTRDAWLKFEGEKNSIDQVVSLFSDLEESRRKAGPVSPPAFRFAMEAAAKSAAEKRRLTELLDHRLLGSAGKPPVTPRNANQLEYLKLLGTSDVVFGLGPAGTGKTYLSMAYALDALKKRNIDRIILTRPAVEAGEALGFLPGDLEEKVLPYLRPLYDALNDMLEPMEAQKLAEKNLIEIAPLAYMRGRTLNNACVILDEAQNTTREQMFMFLTRIGEGSQCIVTGDPSQIDLRPKTRSGILEAISLLRDVEGISFVEFEARDVVRHPVVGRIIEAYDKGRDSDPSVAGKAG